MPSVARPIAPPPRLVRGGRCGGSAGGQSIPGIRFRFISHQNWGSVLLAPGVVAVIDTGKGLKENQEKVHG